MTPFSREGANLVTERLPGPEEIATWKMRVHRWKKYLNRAREAKMSDQARGGASLIGVTYARGWQRIDAMLKNPAKYGAELDSLKRCVSRATLSGWRNAIEGKKHVHLGAQEHVSPTHVREIVWRVRNMFG